MKSHMGGGLPPTDFNDNAIRRTLRSALRLIAGKPAATFLIGLFLSFSAHAFDLQQLSDQLAKPSVIHGNFTQ